MGANCWSPGITRTYREHRLGVARNEMDPTPRRKRLILAICCLSLLIVGMDATIVNVALPSIRTDLHADVSDLQ